MAMMKYGYATVAEPVVNENKWIESVYCKKNGSCISTNGDRIKVARNVLAKYQPDKYLLSHCSIIAAVETELADPKNPKSDYYIKPEFSKFINNNGDAWSKQMLAACYKSFIGVNNFLEHIQIPELSKGKVIDAVLREVPIGKDKTGKDITTYYVDILVATDKKHRNLVADIESGRMNTLSMGCKISFSICTKCGNRSHDDTQACQHVRWEKNNTFYDNNGIQRRIAELCGYHSEPESVIFCDASWVNNPAFTGAVKRNVIMPSAEVMAKLEKAHQVKNYEYKEGDLLRVAQAADEDIPEDIPEDPEKKAPDVSEEPAPEEPAPEEPGPVEEPEDPIKQWKNELKKKILDELKDEIVNEFSPEQNDDARELDTLDDTLIHPTAALKNVWRLKKSWDTHLQKTAGHLDRESFDKLKFGTLMLLTSKDLTALSNYGYNKRDFLAVMSYIDNCLKSPLDMKIKMALADINTRDIKDIFISLNKASGRKITKKEAKKAMAWLRLMDFYEN